MNSWSHYGSFLHIDPETVLLVVLSFSEPSLTQTESPTSLIFFGNSSHESASEFSSQNIIPRGKSNAVTSAFRVSGHSLFGDSTT